jgi:hypothetical protein
LASLLHPTYLKQFLIRTLSAKKETR